MILSFPYKSSFEVCSDKTADKGFILFKYEANVDKKLFPAEVNPWIITGQFALIHNSNKYNLRKVLSVKTHEIFFLFFSLYSLSLFSKSF